MNKIITVYDLLGLIKEGKAPKKIEYQGNILEFDKEDYKFYVGADVLSDDSLVKYISVGNLNEKVEILEEDKHIIEKIKIEEDIVCNKFIRNEYGSSCYIKTHDRIIIEKLNEVIDYINKIIELDGKND